jgi:DNA-binding MarR family transcriptional regulator
MTDLYDDALAPLGIKVTQFSVLRTVQRMGKVSLSELAAEMALDRSTLGRNLRLLERIGLVDLSDGDDQRVRSARLTRRGQSQLRRAIPLWEEAQGKVRARLGSATVEALFRSLERVEALRPHAIGGP